MPTSGAVPVAGSEPRTRTALLLEGIALRHQIAVLERSGTCVWRIADSGEIGNSPHTRYLWATVRVYGQVSDVGQSRLSPAPSVKAARRWRARPLPRARGFLILANRANGQG